MLDKMSRGETDRGWAWVIVAAVTIINVSILPVQQCFGLIFGERFTSLGISATQTSLILHLNGTISCGLGLISGPMMKRFSFRKVAFFGSLTVAIGIGMTAFAVSVPLIIATYCVIFGIGQGVTFLAANLALNTYFRKKRNLAMGFSITLTGLGPILMPLLIAKLLENYATTGTLLILAGIAMHALTGALLLKPFKEEKITNLTKSNDVTSSSVESNDDVAEEEKRTLKSENEADVRNGSVYSQVLTEDTKETENPNCNARKSQEHEEERHEKTTILSKIVRNLDLELLRDSRYVAVVIGMGVSLIAETNFNAMFPFVLAELAGLERTSIATVMSIQAAFDITGRLCVPLLAQKTGWTSRNLYVVSLIGFIIGRAILSSSGNSYVMVIIVAVIVGIAKGSKAVFQALIIPDYVPLERLPAASGIQMFCNGVLSIVIGPIIGLVHDSTNSYVGALHFTSILSLSCVFLWLITGLWSFNGKHVSLNVKTQTEEVEKRAIEC